MSDRYAELQVIATWCGVGSCPTIYAIAGGNVIVQGYSVGESLDIVVPDGEALVEVPRELLFEAVERLG